MSLKDGLENLAHFFLSLGNLLLVFGESTGNLRRLVDAWQNNSKQAQSGQWALSGYSLQAGVYLFHFYQSLIGGRKEGQEDFALTEALSDIVCPQDEHLHLLQVKRTLRRNELREALKEFANVLKVAENLEDSELIDSIRFQVVCGRRAKDAVWPWPDKATLHDEIREYLPKIEARAANPFVLVQADPLQDLWALLWKEGIAEPGAMIRNAAGRFIDAFGNLELLGRLPQELVTVFESAPRRSGPLPCGDLISTEDVLPRPSTSRRVIVGNAFGFKELQDGCFRSRPRVFADLMAAFEQWNLSEDFSTGGIPVFWIDGRSGEGKSVLFRQLIASILLNIEDRVPIFEVRRQEVPQAIFDRRQLETPMFLATDDLYGASNRELWDEQLTESTLAGMPPVRIITCGPTDQLEQLQRSHQDKFAITRFTVPAFLNEERAEFVEWFVERTGREVDLTKLTAENALLVQFMFEMAEGSTLAEFASRFLERLKHSRALSSATMILIFSALYLDTPVLLLDRADGQDAIDRLSQEDQRHFYFEGDIVRFAHAHLASKILQPILEVQNPTISWEIAWARELAEILDVEDDVLTPSQKRTLLHRFGLNPMTQSKGASALAELYRRRVKKNGGRPDPCLLPVWIKLETQVPNLVLNPCPLKEAFACLSDPSSNEKLPISTIPQIWNGRHRTGSSAEEVDQACWDFLLQARERGAGTNEAFSFINKSDTSEEFRERFEGWLDHHRLDHPVPHFLSMFAFAKPKNPDVRRRALGWLEENTGDPRAYRVLTPFLAYRNDDAYKLAFAWLDATLDDFSHFQVLAPLVRAWPKDTQVYNRAISWIDTNVSHPGAYTVLLSLLKSRPKDSNLPGRAYSWLDHHVNHPHSHWLLAALVANRPKDTDALLRACDWLDDKGDHVDARLILVPLIKGRPGDDHAYKRAIKWMTANSDRLERFQVLSPLAATWPEDPEVRRLALEWISESEDSWLSGGGYHVHVWHSLIPLVKRSPADEDVYRPVMKWLTANKDKPERFQLLVPLAANRPSDPEVLRLALEWVSKNIDDPQAKELLAPLVANQPDNLAIREMASLWFQGNSSLKGASVMLPPLIARCPDDQLEEWLEIGMKFIKGDDENHVPEILPAILMRSRARSDILDYALRLVVGGQADHKQTHVLKGIGRACTFNPEEALEYLSSCTDSGMRDTLVRSIAEDLKRHDQRLLKVLSALKSYEPGLVFAVLNQILGVVVNYNQFALAVGDLLEELREKPGYEDFMKRLKGYPTIWKFLNESEHGFLG